MRSSIGLSRVASHTFEVNSWLISLQHVFFQNRKVAVMTFDESFFVYRGDVVVYIFARLKPGFTWVIIL